MDQSPIESVTLRPSPLKMRADLIVQQVDCRGVTRFVIKDPVGLKYWHFNAKQMRVLETLDGSRSLEMIRQQVQAEFRSERITHWDIQKLILDFHKKGLVVSNRFRQAPVFINRRRDHKMQLLTQLLSNPLFIKLPGFDPEFLLRFLCRWFGWFFSIPCLILSAIITVSTWFAIFAHTDTLRLELPAFNQFFGWPNVIYLWFVIGATKIIHELGHGLANKRAGCECHTIGFAFLIFSPTMYCDASDSWMLKDKWKRIGIAAAGIHVESLMASLAFWLWCFSEEGIVKHLLLNLFFVSTISTVIFNANPLMKFDGYYMLSDWLEIPNFRDEASKYLQRVIGISFGLDIEDTTETTAPRWMLLLYAIAVHIYQVLLSLSISLGLYVALKPYQLQSIGVSCACFVVATSVYRLGSSAYRTWKLHSGEPILYARTIISTCVCIAGLLFVMAIPIPIYRGVPLFAEPEGIRHVYASYDGVLTQRTAVQGETVKKGQVIAVLRNYEFEDQSRQIALEYQNAKVDSDTAHRTEDHASFLEQETKLQQTLAMQEQLATQFEELEIRAPCDGMVIWPEKRQAVTQEQQRKGLSTWTNVPLDPQNEKCLFLEGDHLFSVAPSKKFVAKMVVDQHDRNDLDIETAVRIKFDHSPLEILHGKVTEISQEHSEVVPVLLTSKRGGKIPTVTDSAGEERLTSNAYFVTASLEDSAPNSLVYLTRGKGRFLVSNRTTGQWIYRWFAITFRFRL